MQRAESEHLPNILPIGLSTLVQNLLRAWSARRRFPDTRSYRGIMP